MKEKIKTFWSKHKVKICLVGGTIVTIIISCLVLKDGGKTVLHQNGQKFDLTGHNIIHWPSIPGSMSLSQVKEVLEANKDNASQFAIFREGPNPQDYVTIMLSDDVILP